MRAALTYAASSALILVASVVYASTRPAPYNPITYETQQILIVNGENGTVAVPRLPGIDGPAILVGTPGIAAAVPVRASACNMDTGPVPVHGIAEWHSVDPLGFRHRTADGPNVVAPGCAIRNFQNPVPADVLADVETLARQGRQNTKWHIVGEVTPLQPGGVTALWTTETFTLSLSTGPDT